MELAFLMILILKLERVRVNQLIRLLPTRTPVTRLRLSMHLQLRDSYFELTLLQQKNHLVAARYSVQMVRPQAGFMPYSLNSRVACAVVKKIVMKRCVYLLARQESGWHSHLKTSC